MTATQQLNADQQQLNIESFCGSPNRRQIVSLFATGSTQKMEEESVEYDGGVVRDWHRSARQIRVAFGVAVIPEEAFWECEDLRAVDLNSIATISRSAFNRCRSLERVVWPTASALEIGHGAFCSCERLRAIDLRNATKIGACAFAMCKSLERVSIPPSVAEVGVQAFQLCETLVEVKLGEGIERIGQGAFYGCKSLARINIPPSITDIGPSAFSQCSELAVVELNEGLQAIGDRAFQGCASLTSISISSTALNIGDHSFAGCNQLRHAELQEGLKVIESGAFLGCHSLERITIPSSVQSVGRDAFAFCTRLAEVTLREGVYYIELGAFDRCMALEHITIPPVAFVIDIRAPSCQLLKGGTMPVPQHRKLVVSKWMQYRSPGQLAEAQAKVLEVLGRRFIGHRQYPEDQKIDLIREWFAYYDLLDVTTMLELAIWKAKMDDNGQDSEASISGGRHSHAVIAGFRQASRRSCGSDMNVIIPSVLEYLEG